MKNPKEAYSIYEILNRVKTDYADYYNESGKHFRYVIFIISTKLKKPAEALTLEEFQSEAMLIRKDAIRKIPGGNSDEAKAWTEFDQSFSQTLETTPEYGEQFLILYPIF